MKRLIPLLALALMACQASTSVGPINSGLLPSPTPSPAITHATPPPQPDAPTRLLAEVVKTEALLRDGPGEAGRIIGRPALGTIVAIKHPERGGPWYEVTYEAGARSGWMHASLLRFKTGASTAYSPPTTPTPPPATPRSTPVPSPSPDLSDIVEDVEQADDIKVWVNTNSGVYHCPGTRWYGNTKEGEYMTQAQAVVEGHRPAYGRKCN